VSGRAALRLLEAQGDIVVVYDADPAALEGLAEGRRVLGGPWDPGLLAGIDLVVASPGVPEQASPLRDALAAGLTVWGELELAARHLSVPLLAVTATNGKTTITQMAVDMLRASGRRAAAVGNIGVPLTDAVGGDWEVLVVEASSFQLRFTAAFHPRAAVLLNVAPTTWTGTGTSPPTWRPRRASTATRGPATCWYSTPTTRARRQPWPGPARAWCR